MSDQQPRLYKSGHSDSRKAKVNQNKRLLVTTEELKSEKQEKNRRIHILQDTYSSPVCYAREKDEIRSDFQDE